MRSLFLMFVLTGCGNVQDKPTTTVDAPVTPLADAPADVPVDMPPAIALDCATYCTTIAANCTGANAQYPDTAHCMGTCAAFDLGTAGQISGNTLGCRLYHAGMPAMTDPNTHCVHAGPGGDKTSAAAPGTCGDACNSFCAIEIKACGVTGDSGGHGQYTNVAACNFACAMFEKTHLYSITSTGDSLACRLYHATNAAITGLAASHCLHTSAAGGTNVATCMAGTLPGP
jgi:hypothetical protein